MKTSGFIIAGSWVWESKGEIGRSDPGHNVISLYSQWRMRRFDTVVGGFERILRDLSSGSMLQSSIDKDRMRYV